MAVCKRLSECHMTGTHFPSLVSLYFDAEVDRWRASQKYRHRSRFSTNSRLFSAAVSESISRHFVYFPPARPFVGAAVIFLTSPVSAGGILQSQESFGLSPV